MRASVRHSKPFRHLSHSYVYTGGASGGCRHRTLSVVEGWLVGDDGHFSLSVNVAFDGGDDGFDSWMLNHFF